MKCPECGSHIPDDVHGCAQCGRESHLDDVTAALKSRDICIRTEAKKLLFQPAEQRTLGPLMDAAIAALKSRDLDVRIDAAKLLRHHPGERAVQPLVDALRSTFAMRSPWAALAHGYFSSAFFMIVVFPLLWFLSYHLPIVIADGISGSPVMADEVGPGLLIAQSVLALILPFFVIIVMMRRARKKQSELCRLIIEALEQVSRGAPIPELAMLRADLTAIAANRFKQDEETRRAAVRFRDKVESIAAQLGSLPTAAQAPTFTSETLPRSAQSQPLLDNLPRSTTPDAADSS